ncbi:hypothetical protein PV04_03396 [Phialophora macrospora]|uniref:Protein kinase domain-containing protein n=1 Tax=Phialophora macrospora TaxID=1851006 RepID=A0A0D2D136_9EURO|nr:hypothetical protein PV04_03396 [Phialophora macrospora]
MELFTTSDLPPTTLSGPYLSLLDAGAGAKSADTDGHHNFLRLLQHAVSLDTRILPLTWDPMLEKVGPDGATGSVNQNLLNSQVTFAFKRFKVEVTDPSVTQQDFRTLQYDAMINELTVLSNRAVREHANIAVFVGLCFELSPAADAAWPVLVFTKATQSDLGTFMAKGDRQGSDFLLGVCTEIARGIEILHECGVVHGDIKPGNILVSEDLEQSATSVMLTDFGFSRFAATEEDLVRLQRSEPWEAPEWRSHQYFTLGDAKKLDMYSFGLLCMWLFFKDETLQQWDYASVKVHTAFADKDSHAFEDLQFNKHSSDDLILQLAEKLVETNNNLGPETQARLTQIFRLTLGKDPKSRASCMGEIVQALSHGEQELRMEETSQLGRVVVPQWHGSLQMDKLLFPLESCDFRLHQLMVRYMEEMANSESCGVCAENAAFQLALCHRTGFGTQANEVQANEWLSKSEKGVADATAALQRTKESKEGAGTIATLAKLGYRNDLASRFRRDGILADAINYYRRTILTRQQLFGPTSFSTLRLQGILVDLLRWNDQSKEALGYALRMLQTTDDLALSDQVEIKTKLALVYSDLGDQQEAERITKELREIYSAGPESEHSERLENQQDYVKHLLRQKRFDDAIALAEKTLQDCEQELGPLHSSTRGAMRCLAASYHASGQLERATEIDEKLVRIQEGFVIGKKVNPKLVEDVSRMGVRYYQLGKQDSALDCYKKVQDLIDKDNEMAQHAVIGVNNYATELIRRDSLDLALTILDALLPKALEKLGHEHRESALIMGNLAYIHSQRGDLENAESLERQVAAVRQKRLGRSHHDTIIAMGNLRSTLLAQGKYEEAAEVGREECSAIDDRPDVSLAEKIDAARTVARALESGGAFAEALPFLMKEIDLMSKYPDANPGGPLSTMALAALCYSRMNRGDEARKLTVDILNRIARGASVDAEDFLTQMLHLAEKLLEQGYKLEVEQILAVAFAVSRQSDQQPSIAPDTKRKLANLLSRYLEQNGLREATIRFDPSILSPQTTDPEPNDSRVTAG